MKLESIKSTNNRGSTIKMNEQKPITFLELIQAIWEGKWLICFSVVLFTGAAVLYALSSPNIYKASALLSPSESQSGSGLGGMANQLGGLAALAGVDIGGGEGSQTALAVQVLNSRKFVSNFITNRKILVPLMATNGWEMVSDSLQYDEEVYDPINNLWLREPKGLRKSKPSSQEAYDVFINEVFSITQDKENGSFTISIMHYSPFLAQTWVNWLVDDINEVMRERKKRETQQNLAYLNNQLNKTSVAEMQSTFYELIKEQTKSLMLTEVQKDFVFKVVDPAVVPEMKLKPQRAVISLMGFVLGGIIGLLVVFLRFVIKKDKASLL